MSEKGYFSKLNHCVKLGKRRVQCAEFNPLPENPSQCADMFKVRGEKLCCSKKRLDEALASLMVEHRIEEL